MVMISSSGQTVRITMKDLRVMGRNTQGVKLVNLKEGDSLVAIQKIEDTGTDIGLQPIAEIPQDEQLTDGQLVEQPVDSLMDIEESEDEGLQELNVTDDEHS